MLNWNEYRGQLAARIGELAAIAPETTKAFGALDQAAAKVGCLDARTRELIALAVAVTTRCDGCISFHTKAAKEAGVTQEELAEALSMAIALNAGAAMIYTARTFDAFEKA